MWSNLSTCTSIGRGSLILVILFLLLVTGCTSSVPLAGVILTTGKDSRVFEKSIHTALKYLVDVDKFYVITPDKVVLEEKFGRGLGKRVVFVDEKVFPFNNTDVAEVMIQSVKDRGKYPINGMVLKLDDFVLLDSDVIWFQPVRFLNHTNPTTPTLPVYNYASSGQYHQPYFASLKKIGGVEMFDFTGSVFRSGIVHHMVIVKAVLQQLQEDAEALHNGIPFWKVLLNESAAEMTCRAPREQICGAGSTLSEYELYFNYARNKFPQTLNFRPLLWANGPMPGLLYWPEMGEDGKLVPDRHKHVWMGHRQNQVMEAFERQIQADQFQGYHYVGYHAYAKRRYYEMVQPDYLAICEHLPKPFNTTCSWRGFEERVDKTRTEASWFSNCACALIGS